MDLINGLLLMYIVCDNSMSVRVKDTTRKLKEINDRGKLMYIRYKLKFP